MVINWGTFLLLFIWGLLIMNMWHTSSAGLSNAPTNLLIGKLWSFVAISILFLLFLDGTISVCQIGGNGGFLTAHANCGNYGKYPSHPIPTHVIAFTFISSHPIPSHPSFIHWQVTYFALCWCLFGHYGDPIDRPNLTNLQTEKFTKKYTRPYYDATTPPIVTMLRMDGYWWKC